MEVKFCELPQGMRFVALNENESGLGLYIPRDSLDAPAAVQLSMLAGNDYLDWYEVQDNDFGDPGHVLWFTDKGRCFMDECRRFADLLHFISPDKTGKKKEEDIELNRMELSRLAFYNDRVNNIYVAMRDGKADLQFYPILARLESLGLIAVSLIEEENVEKDLQPKRFFRISVTDKGREALRRIREKDR